MTFSTESYTSILWIVLSVAGLLGAIIAMVWIAANDFNKSLHELFWTGSFGVISSFVYFRGHILSQSTSIKLKLNNNQNNDSADYSWALFSTEQRSIILFFMVFTYSFVEFIWTLRKALFHSFEIKQSELSWHKSTANYVLRVVLLTLINLPIVDAFILPYYSRNSFLFWDLFSFILYFLGISILLISRFQLLQFEQRRANELVARRNDLLRSHNERNQQSTSLGIQTETENSTNRPRIRNISGRKAFQTLRKQKQQQKRNQSFDETEDLDQMDPDFDHEEEHHNNISTNNRQAHRIVDSDQNLTAFERRKEFQQQENDAAENNNDEDNDENEENEFEEDEDENDTGNVQTPNLSSVVTSEGILNGGLWALSRHPSHVGSSILWIGIWFFVGSSLESTLRWIFYIISPILFVVCSLYRSQAQEMYLVRLPGYRFYQAHVPFWIGHQSN